ncbi:MAG: glycosyl transferase [Acetobacterium woodii]|nr:glycosyl transferase [Acetobacterium woodii]
MAKILMINMPLHGHVNPTIALTKTLVERDHEVTYLINDEFGKKIAPLGASIITYESTIGTKVKFSDLFATMSNIYYKALEIAGDFDCIIYEMGFFYGAKLGEELGIKTVCLNTTFVLNESVGDDYLHGNRFLRNIRNSKAFRKALSNLLVKDKSLRRTDLIYEVLDHKPDLNIVYTSREFQLHNEQFDEKQFVFIGPSVGGRQQESDIPFDQMNGKIVYISLGTISTNALNFFKTCIDAFADTDVSVIMSIGKQINAEDLGTIPDNFYVYPFVNQVAVLEQSDLFITHCGMNSANEAMYYGVPIIGIPQRADQPLVANRMNELGLGEVINKKEVTEFNLRKMATKVLNDSFYQANMTKIRQEIQSAGGSGKAADEIEQYISDRCQYPTKLAS